MTKRSSITLFALLALFASSLLLLAACGSGSDDSTQPTATPQIITPGPMRLVAGCQPGDVDNWSERASYLTEAFGAAMVQAANTARADLGPPIAQMYTYKRSLDDLIVPASCAQETQELINMLTYEVINTFEAYRSDPNVDVRSMVTRNQATLQLIQLRIDELTVHMEATYEAIHHDS